MNSYFVRMGILASDMYAHHMSTVPEEAKRMVVVPQDLELQEVGINPESSCS